MDWTQTYDPLGKWILSTLGAALPVVVLLGGLAFGHMTAHVAAILGPASALAAAVGIFGRPASTSSLRRRLVRHVGQAYVPPFGHRHDLVGR